MKLNMPEVLKVLLVDDWQAVTKHNQVSRLLHSSNSFLLTILLSLACNITTDSQCR